MLAPEAEHPYTYEGLCAAIDNYNEGHAEKIFMMGTEQQRKSELAAFLGHTLHESDDWTASREYLVCGDNQVVDGETYCKPCDSDSFNWDTMTCGSVGLVGMGLTYNGYCDFTLEPPAACGCDVLMSEPAPLDGYIPASQVFFGRGAIQLSWNYNYRSASEALTGDSSTFCENPDLVATIPEYAWGAGVFFWMEALKEETTCHIEALRNGDFGGTLNNINGGLECPAYHGGWHGEAIKMRLNRYCKASLALDMEEILIFEGCKLLNSSFAECLDDGTCPDCARYSDALDYQTSTSDPAPEALSTSTATTTTTSTTTVSTATTSSTTTVTEPQPVTTPDPTPKPTPRPTEEPAEEEPSAGAKPDTGESPGTPDPTPNPTPHPTLPPQAQANVPCSGDLRAVDGLPGCCVPEPAYHGDGACDPESPYNTAECAFDGGDCCKATCDLSSIYGCSTAEDSITYGPFGYFCVNPNLDEFIDPQLCSVSDRTRIGDGKCDSDVNTEACNWDGGDW